MKLTYDPKCNIAYLRLHEKTAQVTTIRVSDELNVDMTPDGTVYGIELLNANAQLEQEDNGALVLIDSAMTRRHKRPLAVREKKTAYATRAVGRK
jgi:uncharacterized protein YuzE